VIDKAFFEGIAALSLKKITQYSAKRSYAKSGSYFLIITYGSNMPQIPTTTKDNLRALPSFSS